MRPADWAPLADRDPIPGDAVEISALAGRIRDVAATIREQTQIFLGIDAGEVWEGDSAEKFRDLQSKLPPDLDLVATRYEGVDSALTTWSSALSGAQGEADAALADAQAAQEAIDLAEAGIAEMEEFDETAAEQARLLNEGNPDPSTHVTPEAWTGPDHRQAKADAEADLQAARDRLARAVEARDEAEDAAVRSLADAVDDELKNRGGLLGWFEEVYYDVSAWVDEHADVLNIISDVLNIASMVLGILALFIPVLAPFALALGLLALGLDLLLMTAGEKNWVDIGLDVLGVVTFGAGRAFGGAARVVSRANRAAVVVESAGSRATTLAGRLDDAIALRNALTIGRNGRPLAGAALNSRMPKIMAAEGVVTRLQGSLAGAERTAARAESLYTTYARNMPTGAWPGWQNVKAGFNPVAAFREGLHGPTGLAALDGVEANLRGLNGPYAFTGQVIDFGVGNLVSTSQGIGGLNDLVERIGPG